MSADSPEDISLGYLSYRSRHRRAQDDAAHAELNGEAAPQQVHDHALAASNTPRLIETQDRLDAALSRLRDAGSFAYDTEFIGEHTYYPQLCLIQTATQDRVDLIDPMADLDLTGFWKLLADPSVQVLVHAGMQDLEPVYRHLGRPAANIVDTQIAAAFCAMDYPLSLKRLLGELLEMDLGKQLKFSQWDRRPLSPEQQHYAGEDVRYLPAAWAELSRRIEAAGNMPLVNGAMQELCDASNYAFDPLSRRLKAKGVNTLGRRKKAALEALQIWRETLARDINVPPRSLLPDPALVDLAATLPTCSRDVDTVKGIPRPLKQRYLPDMLGVIAQAVEGPLPPRSHANPRDHRDDRDRVDALWTTCETKCLARGVTPQVVTSKKELSRVLASRDAQDALAGSPLSAAWRRDVLGDALADITAAIEAPNDMSSETT